ncbi:MAG: ABC transporter substrate-binding protein, partial [Planctomycetota bacterium]
QNQKVPVYPYQHIVSMAISCDEILQKILVQPTRVLAYTASTLKSHPDRHWFQGRPFTYENTSLEILLSWKPDLILVAGHTDISIIQRLREAGIQVFNIGTCSGVNSYLEQIRTLGSLLEEESRAHEYAKIFLRRLKRIAPESSKKNSKRVLYLELYGDKMFGGGKNTSYNDVILYAGFRDAAAEAHIEGYISYNVEKLLEINPDIIICAKGMKNLIRKIPGASEALTAVQKEQIYEFPGTILSSASDLMLLATEEVHAAISGEDE